MSIITVDIGNALKDGVSLRLPEMHREEFYEFCQRNPDLNVELSPYGDIILMSPADNLTDSINVALTTYLYLWNAALEEPGKVYGPTAGFTLPNGAVRSPDASWISPERWRSLTEEQQAKFAQVCPDFVLELMSPSDRIGKAREKMVEYIANGARLGWLIDRKRRRIHVYRPQQEAQTLEDPVEVLGDPELPGFVLRLERIF